MNYSKPEVNTLGEALIVIEFVGKPRTATTDGGIKHVQEPAYDLDE